MTTRICNVFGVFEKSTAPAWLYGAMATALTASTAPMACIAGNNYFSSPNFFDAGASPQSVVTGDFNGDGKLDLVVANNVHGMPSTISLLLGVGDGSFWAPRVFNSGLNPVFIAVGDVNGDGNLDLAIANEGDTSVRVLLGNGFGSFPSTLSVAVGIHPTVVALRDLNQDGDLDLVVGGEGIGNAASQVQVRLGNGSGTFFPHSSLEVGSPPTSIAVADFDNDGDLDLAVPTKGTPILSQGVRVLLNDGGGTLSLSINIPVGTDPQSIIVAEDINNDGNVDLAVTNMGHAGGRVHIFLGDGAGDFASTGEGSFATGLGPVAMATADFNADGHVDLVVANITSGDATVLLGDGLGNFPISQNYVAGDRPNSVAVGDFDLDGDLDLAVTNRHGPVAILKGDGAGGFMAPLSFIIFEHTVSKFLSVVVDDFNGDSTLDLAVLSNNNDQSFSPISLLLGVGDGTFSEALSFHQKAPQAIASGDFNGDGNLDLAVATHFADGDVHGNEILEEFVSLHLGNGDGTFANAGPRFDAGAWPRALAVGDFDNDGDLDLAVANRNFFSDLSLSVLLGDGFGSFSAPTKFIAGFLPTDIITHDFNGDGNLDLALVNRGLDNSPGSLSIHLGTGDGTFSPARFFPVSGTPSSMEAGDFDNDGDLDIAVKGSFLSGATLIMLGNGLGDFSKPTPLLDGANTLAVVAVGDIDGDGVLDLVASGAQQSAARNFSVLLGDGDGMFFGGAISAFVNSGAIDVGLGDFDNDGDLDIAVVNLAGGNAIVLLNTALSSVADLNCDGCIDGIDLVMLISSWGTDAAIGGADLTRDGRVDAVDLALLLANWAPCP